jgi:hypothetical protein
MPGYIEAALHKYQHAPSALPEHAPHMWNPPIYGAKTHYVEDKTTSPALSYKDVNKFQLYYARAVNPFLITPINVIASKQSKPTAFTADKFIKLLNYCNTHP